MACLTWRLNRDGRLRLFPALRSVGLRSSCLIVPLFLPALSDGPGKAGRLPDRHLFGYNKGFHMWQACCQCQSGIAAQDHHGRAQRVGVHGRWGYNGHAGQLRQRQTAARIDNVAPAIIMAEAVLLTAGRCDGLLRHGQPAQNGPFQPARVVNAHPPGCAIDPATQGHQVAAGLDQDVVEALPL
jgi:hypothetical protein